MYLQNNDQVNVRSVYYEADAVHFKSGAFIHHPVPTTQLV